MSRRKPNRPAAARPPADLEEIAPRRFLVRNKNAYRLLKGEGTFQGMMFELTTWRREGLLARLRENGFVVHTLSDQVQALPGLPPPVPIGEAAPYPARPRDAYSYFDPERLAWEPLEAETRGQQTVVLLRAGWVARRRRHRTGGDYYRVLSDHSGTLRLARLSETEALMAGYAQAAARRAHPLPIRTDRHQQEGHQYYLPLLVLPAPHHALLQKIAEATEQGWKVNHHTLSLACQVYERLGVRLSTSKKSTPPRRRQ
jgi:hypothetical protein